MKRIFIIVAVILAAVLLLTFHKTPVTTAPGTPVSVTLDSGSSIATVSGINAQNAFDALKGAADKQKFELKTKQYDFGVFVEQIGTKANTKEKSWIYFVNGKAGTVAADKQKVGAGDMVEWKYTTPTME